MTSAFPPLRAAPSPPEPWNPAPTRRDSRATGLPTIRQPKRNSPPSALASSRKFEASDPYAVRTAFTLDDSDEAVEWIIGRDLLIEGLKGPVGEGDVRLWPAGERDRGSVYIVLKPPDGVALLEAPTQDIKKFLQETDAHAPTGSESEHIDSDALLRHLLAKD
ncbi:SsgA family sporulation/cell division regulator [Streptomyces sp. NPDC002206]